MADKTTKITTYRGKRLPKLNRGDGGWYKPGDRDGLMLRHSIGGKPWAEYGDTPDECIAKRNARRGERSTPAGAPTSGPMTIAAMLDEWRTAETTTHGARASTLKGNRWAVDVLTREAGTRDAIALTSVEARTILVAIAKRYKSVAKVRSIFNQALQHLVDTGRRATNPLAGAAKIKSDDDLANATEWLTEPQAVETLAYFAADPKREHAALAVSMLAGLRPGEACALSWPAVDFERGTIRVDYTVDRDTGEPSPKLKTDHHGERHRKAAHRTVPMHPDLASILRRHRLATGGTGLVFAKGDGPLHPQDLFYASKAVSTTLGHVSYATGDRCHVSPNGYRHTFASRLAVRGFPAVLGAKLMGHVDTTQWNRTYTHANIGLDEIDLGGWLGIAPAVAA